MGTSPAVYAGHGYVVDVKIPNAVTPVIGTMMRKRNDY